MNAWWSLYKQHHLLVTLAASTLLLGLACHFFFSDESPVSETLFLQKNVTASKQPPPAEIPLSSVNQTPQEKGKCDLFTGNWIPNPAGPVYTNESCQLIEGHQNCIQNGRPDLGFLYWKWSPRECQLPPFDAVRFLGLMRDKSWALIGDSISRNHVQSLLCMLSKVEQPVQVYHDAEYKSKRWQFPSHNFSISVIWSPLLVKSAIFEDDYGVSKSALQLHLDKLDNWTKVYEAVDYVIISTGEWFLKPGVYYLNETIVGCHYCPGTNLTELGFGYAYREALRHVLNFITSSNHKGVVFFRTSTPDHFENAEWNNGGNCPRTSPVKEGETELTEVKKILLRIELEEFKAAEGAAVNASGNGTNLKLLDFTKLLLVRPDGHPGPYRYPYPFAKDKNATVQNDCLHWCLPGPIDTLNDLIMEMIKNG